MLWSLKHDMELALPLVILLRIPFAPYDPHYGMQLQACFMWFTCFPFRYYTTLQLQSSVSKIDAMVSSPLAKVPVIGDMLSV